MYLSLSLSLSLYLSLSLSLFLVWPCLLITLIKCLTRHKDLESLFDGVLSITVTLNVFVFIVGQVVSTHQSDQMSKRSQELHFEGILGMSLSEVSRMVVSCVV